MRAEELTLHTQQNIPTDLAVESRPSNNECHELWLLK
jgi:hypothetical protein